MRAQHAGDLLHRSQSGAHGPFAPIIQELIGPPGSLIVPEASEILFEQIGPHGLEVQLQQFLELDRLRLAQILGALEQTPATDGQHGLLPMGFEFLGFCRPHLVNGLGNVSHDMEAIQHMQRLTGHLSDNTQVGLPHVAADEREPDGTLLAEVLEELPQGFLGALLADPQQPPATGIDLVNQRQILVSSLPCDLVDADGGHVLHVAVGQAPGDRHLHRAKDVIPRSMENGADLLPRQSFGPAGQKPRIGGCKMVLPLGPRHPFHLHAAARASNPPHGVEEEYGDAPQGNELEAALGKNVIPGSTSAATRTGGSTSFPSPDFNLKDPAAPTFAPTDRPVDKTSVQLDPIEDRLKQHPVLLCPVMDFLVGTHNVSHEDGMLFFSVPRCPLSSQGGEIYTQILLKSLEKVRTWGPRCHQAGKTRSSPR